METLAVKSSIWIDTSLERVWRAITEPQHLDRWYAPGCPWEIPALKVGETVKFYNTDTDVQLATIEVVDPPRKFVLHWQPDPAYPAAKLVNTFILSEENGGTRMTVSQTGYECLPDDIRQQSFEADLGAYAAITESLKAYLEHD